MPAKALNRADVASLAGSLTALTSISWAYLFFDAARMSHGRSCCTMLASTDLTKWSAAGVGMLGVMWIVMMVAMMTPTATPMLLMFARVQKQRRADAKPFVPTGIFLLGYLIVWTGFSLLATAAQAALHARALLSQNMASTSPRLGGGLLIAAGLFQFTPLKHACLRHCRSPISFLLTDWREGSRGALIMGLRHGLSCTGCCWLLMALLFVLGVMNLIWVAAITAFVLLEKIAPKPRLLSAAAGLACIAWGVIVLRR